jgi:dephospho-CoA kinase
MNYFDVVIFIKAKKKLRLKRFKSKKGNEKLFKLLDNKQIKDKKKIRFCDFVVVNEKNLNILKKKLSAIISKYE